MTRGLIAAVGILCGSALAPAAPSAPLTTSDLVQELRAFRQTASVLYIAAHPDDENNRLLPYLARGRSIRVGYLSLTRGDGGQNLIGSELGEELGVIRTQELLAARRIDGAEQYFSRAKDFGFSKDAADTLKRWDRQQVLADIVRVIRTFRPDVVLTRFSPVPGGTHGHHTASAILALEAFKLSGDPTAFADELRGLEPWQPKRILWNGWVPPGTAAPAGMLQLDAGGYDPLLGESFGEIGARGRSMHKSQGEGRSGVRGSGPEYFQLLAGDPVSQDLFDGVDGTWARVPGGADIDRMAAETLTTFDPQNPSASVPRLLAIREKLTALAADPIARQKRAQLDRILQACLGLFVETVLPQASVVPGEALKLRHSVIVRSGFPVRWLGVRYSRLGDERTGAPVELKANEVTNLENAPVLPADTQVSQPYWLRADGTEGMFRVDETALIGLAENPPAFPVTQLFEVGGQTLEIADEPVQVITDPVRGEIRRRLDVIAPVNLAWSENITLVAPGQTKPVTLTVQAARASLKGSVRVATPAGWQVSPAAADFELAAANDRTSVTFQLTAPAAGGAAKLSAIAEVGGRTYDRGRAEVRYDHIPAQLLQPVASANVVSFDLQIKGRTVAYLPGAGDLVPESLRRMGYEVTLIGADDLTVEKLRSFDSVVIGVRAFNTRSEMEGAMPALFAFAEQGGTVVAQYNTTYGLLTSRLAPYPLELSRDRVTDASASVTLLAPDHPALTGPNRISPADFHGWVQERARFVPKSWDTRFTPLLAMSDPGEQPLNGTLLVAHHGKGYFVYTSLSWFRELPAGVPGAYRLFANLVSLGK